MVQASVGFQCPECVRQGTKNSPIITPRSMSAGQPYATYVLIALNALGVLAVMATGGSLLDGGGTFTEKYGLVAGVPGQAALGGVGGQQWYRLFTGAFVHAGILHFGMNMFVLWIIGAQLERIVGAVRYVSLYVVALFAGAFAVMLVDPGALTVGASGAIFGLMGAAASWQRSRGISLAQSGLGALIVLNLVFSFAIPGISVAGHIGGLIGGGLMGWLVFQLEGKVRSEWVAAGLCAAVSVALIFAGVQVAQHYVTNGHAIL